MVWITGMHLIRCQADDERLGIVTCRECRLHRLFAHRSLRPHKETPDTRTGYDVFLKCSLLSVER